MKYLPSFPPNQLKWKNNQEYNKKRKIPGIYSSSYIFMIKNKDTEYETNDGSFIIFA